MKYLLLTIIGIIAFECNLISQEKEILSHENERDGSMSIQSQKCAIPNYDLSSAANLYNSDTLQKESVSNKNGQRLRREKPLELEFIEQVSNEGYPVGWITNSKSHVLYNSNEGIYLKLDSTQSNVYIGCLLSNKAQFSELILSFENRSNTSLIIHDLYTETPSNPPITIELPFGLHHDIKMLMTRDPFPDNMLIKFQKYGYGEFKLFEINVAGGLDNE